MNIQLKKGILELCVLSTLEKQDCYGYQLANILLTKIDVKEGTIYPLLRRLKKDGYVSTYIKESSEGPPRKYYKLTEDGLDCLSQIKNEWFEFQQAVNSIIKKEDCNE